MIAVRGFAESVNMTPSLFFTPECPPWAKCAVMNADGRVAFFDAAPLGYDESGESGFFGNGPLSAVSTLPAGAGGDWRRSLLIREV